MRLSVVAACLSLCLIGFSSANDAHASIRKETNIPAEGLGPALNALAKDRNFQIVYVTEEIANVHTEGAVGELTTEEALKRLLTGTGLTYRYLDDKTITIGSANTSPERSARASKTTSSGSPDDANANQEGKTSSSGSFRVAQVDRGKTSSAASVGNQVLNSQDMSNNTSTSLSEIIVTAQKKSERLQDVPVPVTVISSASLLASNQTRIQDYYTTIPGLNLANDDLAGSSRIALRGVTTGGLSNPGVGIVIDDVPYGSSTGLGFGYLAPDIDPSDLAQIEVLRGPQGTLYGASSLGGLLKYVTVDPSTEALTGRVQADLDGVHNGDGPGYGVRGEVNIPLSDSIAVRASGFSRKDPGYVDDPNFHISGINQTSVYGGRLSSLWRPSQDMSLKLSALFQNATANGSSNVQPALGELRQSNAFDSGGYHTRVQAYSATFKAKVGIVDLTALSGYSVSNSSLKFDSTSFFGTPFIQSFFPAATAAPSVEDIKTSKFTQEIRAVMPIGDRVEWQIGGFYNHENSPEAQQITAMDFTTGAPYGTFIHLTNSPYTFEEYAAFTDLTVRITDQFDVQLGGRESQNKQSLATTYTGALFGPTPVLIPETDSRDNSFTYLVTPRLKLSPDLMIYARLASGYRPGGPNGTVGVPSEFKPDKTENYELGLKGDFLNHALTVDASVYYIDWKDIQIHLLSPAGAGYISNGSRAKSQGVEFSIQSKPVEGLTLASWIAFDDAKLTEAFPSNSSVFGVSGDRLPDTSRFSGSVSADDEFPLTNNIAGFVGATASYVGDRVGVFTSPPPAVPPRQYYPSYTKVDLRAGVKYEAWRVNLFANNLTDKRAILSGGLGTDFPNAFQYIQPRTVGVSLVKTF